MFGLGKKLSKTRGKIQYNETARNFFQFGNDMVEKLNAENDEQHYLNGRFVVSYSRDIYSQDVVWQSANESLTIYFFPNDVPDEIAENHLHPDFVKSAIRVTRIDDYFVQYRNYNVDEAVNSDYEALVKYKYKDFVSQSRRKGEPFAAIGVMYPSRPKSQTRQEISNLLSQCASAQSEMGD